MNTIQAENVQKSELQELAEAFAPLEIVALEMVAGGHATVNTI